MIVTRSGDTLIGQIAYESPEHFLIKDLSGTARDNHGAAASILRDQVIYVMDSWLAYKLHKFGKIKIYSIHSDKYIHKPFYSANDSSITYISKSENLRDEGWSYRAYDIPIAEVEKIRWHYSSTGGAIAIGAVLGAVIGGVVGASTYKTPDTISGIFTSTAEASGNSILGAIVGAARGGIVGGIIQSVGTSKSTKMELHSD